MTQKYMRTDEGGELWYSHAFQQLIQQMGYILQTTTADASFQNWIMEWPNSTLGDMMHSLLHGTKLDPEYWSWALRHVVYLKNQLPHQSMKTTPLQAYTGKKPNDTKSPQPAMAVGMGQTIEPQQDLEKEMSKPTEHLQVQYLSNNATLPIHSTAESSCLDLFSAVEVTIAPHTTTTNTNWYSNLTTSWNIWSDSAKKWSTAQISTGN